MSDFRQAIRRLGDDDGLRRADRAYETARVQFLVNQAWPVPARPRESARLKGLHAERYGSRELSFGLFAEEHPSFPVVLACHTLDGLQLHRDQGSVFPLWFRRFQDLPFVRPFEAHLEACRKGLMGRAAGLVFPRKGFAQGMVVHTAARGLAFPEGVCVTYTRPRGAGREPVELFVRPFSALAAAAARAWSPGD